MDQFKSAISILKRSSDPFANAVAILKRSQVYMPTEFSNNIVSSSDKISDILDNLYIDFVKTYPDHQEGIDPLYERAKNYFLILRNRMVEIDGDPDFDEINMFVEKRKNSPVRTVDYLNERAIRDGDDMNGPS